MRRRARCFVNGGHLRKDEPWQPSPKDSRQQRRFGLGRRPPIQPSPARRGGLGPSHDKPGSLERRAVSLLPSRRLLDVSPTEEKREVHITRGDRRDLCGGDSQE